MDAVFEFVVHRESEIRSQSFTGWYSLCSLHISTVSPLESDSTINQPRVTLLSVFVQGYGQNKTVYSFIVVCNFQVV